MLMVSIALVLAVVMALMVLLNLNVVLINEKAVELTVMRINGCSIGAAKAYIYRDNTVRTAIRILLGVGVGLLLSVYVINSLRSRLAIKVKFKFPAGNGVDFLIAEGQRVELLFFHRGAPFIMSLIDTLWMAAPCAVILAALRIDTDEEKKCLTLYSFFDALFVLWLLIFINIA